MFTRQTRIAIACAGIFASIASSHTFAANEEFNPIVVSGSKFEQPLSEVLPSVTVITKDQIERSQARSIYEVLQGEPGVEMGANGGLGAVTSLFLRGENSNSVAIYVDGVRIQPDGLGSIPSTSFPPLQSIERIEVLRGNAGALYGEAAIGGAVNIYTNSGSNQPPKAFATLTYGSLNTVDATAGISGRLGDTKFNLSANGTGSSGFTPINSTNPPQSGVPNSNTGSYKGNGFNLGASQIVNQDIEIGLKERYQDNTYNYNSYGTSVDMRTISNDATFFTKFKVNEAWFSQVDYTNSKLNYGFSNLSAAGYSYGPSSETNAINWANNYEISNFNKVSFGLSYSTQKYDDGYSDLMYRDTYGVYFGDTFKWDKFDFQFNGRYDEIKIHQPNNNSYTASLTNNQNFQATSGLFGAGYHLTDELRLTATVSSGFRAPSVSEFFNLWGDTTNACSNYGACFNPYLRPETHHTTEWGFEYKNAYSLSRVVYFDTKTNNAIIYTGYSQYANINTPYSYINVPTVTNHGVEISERATFMGYRLTAAYTHQNPIDTSASLPLLRRANDFGSVDLNKSLGAYDVGSKVVFSGGRFDKDTQGNLTAMGSYQLWSFYAGYKIDDEFSVRVRLDNAFDEKYQLAYGYNTPGRTAWLTLIYKQK